MPELYPRLPGPTLLATPALASLRHVSVPLGFPLHEEVLSQTVPAPPSPVANGRSHNGLLSTTLRQGQLCDHQRALNILLASNQWETLLFHDSEDLEYVAAHFLRVHRLSTKFRKGLADQMRLMVQLRQLSAFVDLVDIL